MRKSKSGKPKGEVLLLILLFFLVFLSMVILSKMMLTSQIIVERKKVADFEQAYWIAEAGISAGRKSFLGSGSSAGTQTTPATVATSTTSLGISLTTTTTTLIVTSSTLQSVSTTQPSSNTAPPSTLSGTVNILSWQGGPLVVLGNYTVQKTTEDANSFTLQSTGSTTNGLTTRIITVKIDKQTHKIVFFSDSYVP